MKPRHYALLIFAAILAPPALYFSGHAMAAGAVLLLTFVLEVIASVTTGKQGNDTEH
ncbi:hypothetical protein HNP48_006332 [Acidovorax soli]|jgi:hypothetical protein|uniref:Uncharacterized protein n=1 Tax=Acidovorax soli TaxID=592050 RepID=A0A7X0UCY9_9BURK|nr:hypothetical protein [Acidovorax soli]MBB6563608.1 hypothetical protein [Acidovorax soli]